MDDSMETDIGDPDDAVTTVNLTDQLDSGSPLSGAADDLDLGVTTLEDDRVLQNGHTTSHGDQVIELLMPSHVDSSEREPVSQTLMRSSAALASAPPVQAITLTDGTTAFIQNPLANKDSKLLAGQTVQLEDGSTAIIQGLEKGSEGQDEFPEGQTIQLVDGTTVFIQHSPKGAPFNFKEGLQAVQLEDGTTAYIAQSTLEELATSQSQNISQALQVKAELVSVSEANQKNFQPVRERPISLGDKSFHCTYDGCGRMYTTQHHLKVHERAHTGDRPFQCMFSDCGKAFATGYGLKSHTRIHTGEKPYHCPEESCDKCFKTSGDLQKHVRTHTGERPFKCPFEGCERSFTTSNIRKVHIRTHTGERPYTCHEVGCGRSFASATNYKNHIRIHTGEKPYVCTVAGCGKRFTEYSSLYKHHVVHTHSKPYVCSNCGKTYRQTSTLAMHKRTAHGEDSLTESESQILVQQADGEDGKEGVKTFQQLQLAPAGLQLQPAEQAGISITTQNVSTADNVLAIQGSQSLTVLPTTTTGMTLVDQDQQVYVITDPAQLEMLQQLAHQTQMAQIQQAVVTEIDGQPTANVSTSMADQQVSYSTE